MENKAIGAYLAVLVLLVIATLFLSGIIGGSKSPSTTTVIIGKNSTTTVSSIKSNTTSTASTSITTTAAYSSCLSKNATVPITNGYFNTGTYGGWSTAGPGFGATPLNIAYANNNSGYFSAPWSGYNGSYIATSYMKGLAVQNGSLTSNLFQVSQLYLNFKLISPENNYIYVELLHSNGNPAIITHYNTYTAQGINSPQTTFVNASIPLGTLLCQNVSIRLVAGVTGLTGQGVKYIAATGFYTSRVPVSTSGIVVNQSIS